MIPIYFPFTCIPHAVAEGLNICFGRTVIYQPSLLKMSSEMHKLDEEKLIAVRRPVSGDESKLRGVVKAYRQWAENHQGSELAFFKTQKDKAPFFEDTAVQQIRSDVRRRAAGEAEMPPPDYLFNARMFLSIAQAYDEQHMALDSDLADLQALEQEMLKNIRGSEDDEDQEMAARLARSHEDAGEYLTESRIRAWARLALHDPEAGGLYVTDSRAVLDWITDNVPAVELVAHVKGLSPRARWNESVGDWQVNLLARLTRVAAGEVADATEVALQPVPARGGRVSLQIFRITGEAPRMFWSRWTGVELPEKDEEEGERTAALQHTLIGLLDLGRPEISS